MKQRRKIVCRARYVSVRILWNGSKFLLENYFPRSSCVTSVSSNLVPSVFSDDVLAIRYRVQTFRANNAHTFFSPRWGVPFFCSISLRFARYLPRFEDRRRIITEIEKLKKSRILILRSRVFHGGGPTPECSMYLFVWLERS